MKYIQIYKNKQVTNSGLQIETINGKTILLTKEEMIIYDCFSTATNIEDVFSKLYGETSIHTNQLDTFNSLFVSWIQSSILKPT